MQNAFERVGQHVALLFASTAAALAAMGRITLLMLLALVVRGERWQ